MASTMPSDMSADVVVVGAGPGGSSTAYHLARAGLDVVLLEKSPFPRDKICGDGLTPAAVHELIAMGVYPFVVPFRPHPGTLAVDVDGATAPDGAVVEKVSREVANQLQLAGMLGSHQKAGCAACGACSVLQNVGG